MSKLIVLVIFSLLILALAAQAPVWEWARQAGGTGGDFGRSLVTDLQGNQYLTGNFQNSASFGAITLISSGLYDIYVAKLDNNGNFLWATRAGGTGYDHGMSIALDAAGNAYLTGRFEGTANFGTYSLTSSGLTDIYVAKLDNNGNFLWAIRAGGTGHDYGLALVTDTASNVLLTGIFRNNVTFGSTTLINYGEQDMYAAKLDTNGNWLWAKGAGGAGIDQGYGIGVDSANNVYFTGSFNGSATFGTTTLTSAGSEDLALSKLDSTGNFLWTVRAGGTGADYGYCLTLNSSNQIILTGWFTGSATFGTIPLISSGNIDVFAAKLDTNGNWLWAKRAGGSEVDRGNAVCVDITSSIYLTGNFEGTATFGSTTLTGSAVYNAFAAKLDTNGNWLWAISPGGYGTDQGYGIATDLYANVYLTGNFSFGIIFGSTTFYHVGSGDIFIAKLQGQDVPLPVELSSFTATATADYFVKLDWTTQSETNLTGYYIYRNTENNLVTAYQITRIIPANNTTQEQHYTFEDREAESGHIYYYWLESRELNSESAFYGPLSVDLNGGGGTPPEIPAITRLYSAYPNPFHFGESAQIKANIAENETGTLSIYNQRGKLIADYMLNAGEHKISFEGINQPSGIYLYKLQTQTSTQVRKMVLIK